MGAFLLDSFSRADRVERVEELPALSGAPSCFQGGVSRLELEESSHPHPPAHFHLGTAPWARGAGLGLAAAGTSQGSPPANLFSD